MWESYVNCGRTECPVSGAKYKGFPMLEKANQVYHKAKSNGEIHIVRNPGVEEKYDLCSLQFSSLVMKIVVSLI